jgi:hypothetical protein
MSRDFEPLRGRLELDGSHGNLRGHVRVGGVDYVIRATRIVDRFEWSLHLSLDGAPEDSEVRRVL